MAGKVLFDISKLFGLGMADGGGMGDNYIPGRDRKMDAEIAKLEKAILANDAIADKISDINKKIIANHAKHDELRLKIATEDDKETRIVLEKLQNRLTVSNGSLEIQEEKQKELLKKSEANLELYFNSISKSHKLSKDQQLLLIEAMKNGDVELEKTGKSLATRLGEINGHASNGFSNILTSSKSFFIEFGIVGGLMQQALHQIQTMNRDLVAFNRSMNQGNFNNSMFGMDLYANARAGGPSLMSISMQNAISEKEFLATFQAFNRGKAMGTGEKDFMSQQDDMNKFGIAAAQLSKFYGVEMGTINTITSNLVYNFGTKVKDLNGILQDGKEAAISAGVSVKEYFSNLKEATDMIGKYYILGGIEGMKNLALYATQTNQTVGQVLASSERFKNFTSQFELQNTAAALGFANASANMVSAWGYSMRGDKAEAQKIFLASVAKDLTNNGGAVDGKVSALGMMNMQQMGMSEEEIKSTQRLLNMQRELGISIDQLTDRNRLDLNQKAKIYEYEHRNLTIGERMLELWGKIRTIIIDPLASLFAPVINGLVSIGNLLADFIYVIGSPLIWPLQMLGKAIGKVANVFEWMAGMFEPVVKLVNDQFKKLGEHGGKLLKIFGAIVGVMELAIIGRFITPLLAGVLMRFTGMISGITRLIAPGTQSLTIAGTGLRGSAAALVAAARQLGLAAIGRNVSPTTIATGAPGSLAAPASVAAGRSLFGIGRGGVFSTAGAMRGIKVGGGIVLGGNLLGMGASAMGYEKAGDAIGTTANWAGIGAAIGSIVPGIGTVAGGVIGAVAGVGKAIYDWIDEDKDRKKENDKNKFEGAHSANLINSKDIQAMITARQGLTNKYVDQAGAVIPSASDVNSGNTVVKVYIDRITGKHGHTIVK